MNEAKILTIDLGSQISEVIARVARENKYRTALLDPSKAERWLETSEVEAIILSGGDNSVYAEGAVVPPKNIFTARRRDGKPVPIFCICYGHHFMAQYFGGRVESDPRLKEYGESGIEVLDVDSTLFHGLPPEQDVQTSHGDTVTVAPPNFKVLARSTKTGGIAAMASDDGRIWCVQFHPEAPETVYGAQMLVNFLEIICGCKRDWEPSDIIASIGKSIKEEVHGKQIAAPYSGGVDSSVACRIATLAVGKQVHGITIDADNLREGEIDEIRFHAGCVGLPLEVADMRASISVFANTTDAEKKRILFRDFCYVPPIVRMIKQKDARYVLQGTLAPDMIESGKRGGALIKTHHNTGTKFGVPELNPLMHLFKHEVRELARLLKLPESISARKPFPGPGNILRVVGVPVIAARLAAVRWAYAEAERIIKLGDPALYAYISQLVVAYIGGSNITGVRGDSRAYEGIAAVRAVRTVDFMTARGIYLPESVARPIISTLSARPPFIRVMIDATDKAPGTIEYE